MDSEYFEHLQLRQKHVSSQQQQQLHFGQLGAVEINICAPEYRFEMIWNVRPPKMLGMKMMTMPHSIWGMERETH